MHLESEIDFFLKKTRSYEEEKSVDLKMKMLITENMFKHLHRVTRGTNKCINNNNYGKYN